VVPLPGGCRIGPRPVDLHLKALAAMGAELNLAHGYVVARAERLRGARIDLRGPAGSTVTGTVNTLSAAVLARGETIIDGAAREPEVVALGEMLATMGARIDGLGSRRIHVRGVDQLGGVRTLVPPDRIEAATLLTAAAITRGQVCVSRVSADQLDAVLEWLDAVGARVWRGRDGVHLLMDRRPRAKGFTALPYPGIPTDVQAQLTALLCLAEGRARLRDAVFPTRTMHLAELRRLGARIESRGGGWSITGVDRLDGAELTASDLRGSAALVLAGLAARGRTRVEQIAWLDRGYERLDQKLASLGARIERVGSGHDHSPR
jgi:UDP-N-acetylglucosamine 1-carboxyvinyltransferase